MNDLSAAVGVVMEHDLGDCALLDLVRRSGYRAVPVDFESATDPAVGEVGAILVRSTMRLAALGCTTPVAVIETFGSAPITAPGVTVIPASDDAAKHLAEFLEQTIGRARVEIVPLSPREREVVTSYVMGATVDQVAADCGLSPATARTYYRRVTDRYANAGRRVANKSELLLEMIADGWVAVPGPSLTRAEDRSSRGR